MTYNHQKLTQLEGMSELSNTLDMCSRRRNCLKETFADIYLQKSSARLEEYHSHNSIWKCSKWESKDCMMGQQERGTSLYLVNEGWKGTWECRELPVWATFKEGTLGKDAQSVDVSQMQGKGSWQPSKKQQDFFESKECCNRKDMGKKS